MKIALALLLACTSAMSDPTRIDTVPAGSGVPWNSYQERPWRVEPGVFHVPQYLHGFPTAATIWPRIVRVPCSGEVCDGYNYLPEMGRSEYLFFTGTDRSVNTTIERIIQVPVPGPTVIREVERKRIRE